MVTGLVSFKDSTIQHRIDSFVYRNIVTLALAFYEGGLRYICRYNWFIIKIKCLQYQDN